LPFLPIRHLLKAGACQSDCQDRLILCTLEDVLRVAAFALSIVITGAIAYCIYCYRIELGIVSDQGPPAQAATAPGRGEPNAQPGPAQADIPKMSWRLIERPAAGFAVEMPAEAIDAYAPAFARNGLREEVPMIEASPQSGIRFAVAWDNDPPVTRAAGEVAEKTLDMAEAGALARTRAVLTGELQSRAEGYPARDFTGRIANGGILSARMIMARRQLFMLIATFPSSSARGDDEVKRFFDSFRLTANLRRN
jgi:hypothetical protein